VERNEARRRAILISYRDFQFRSTVDSLTLIGGLTLDPEDQSLAGAKARGTRQSRMRTLVAAALAAIETESQPGKIQPWQITMHEHTVFGAVPFAWGPYSDWHRNVSKRCDRSIEGNTMMRWFKADWIFPAIVLAPMAALGMMLTAAWRVWVRNASTQRHLIAELVVNEPNLEPIQSDAERLQVRFITKN